MDNNNINNNFGDNNSIQNIFYNINDELNSQLQNPYISGTLNILLILYSSLAAPELPDFMKTFFKSTIGKIIIISLIAFTANKNINISLLVAIAFVITLNFINTEEHANNIAEQ